MRARKTTRDAAWLAVALSDPVALLADHAHCEKKAAANAIGFIARYPERTAIVTAMAALAQEEMGHFAEVHAMLVARGGVLPPDDGDAYAKALAGRAGGLSQDDRLVDRLLIGALIEARSFERLALLGEHHPDPELRDMYQRFARSEARHAALFVALAREVAGDRERVDARLEALAEYEQRLVEDGPLRCAIH
ncbi:MAG: tRNA-(ms[2]io[6]A)-hydroxylase [Deltaproteobacteria bacterium]|nr:tRNA-(ms[2]io[6]A)-hydroxylase [Deltaproteobacteria bacterium]